MKREAIRGYQSPSYPTRDDVGDDALVRWVPTRWRPGSKVAAGMALLVAAAPGVAVADVAVPVQPRGELGPGDPPPPDAARKRPAKVDAIFEHGEGRGSFGCVAVAPPAFLSESDARQIILEEFAKVGVRFKLKGRTLAGVHRRRTESRYHRNDDGTFEEKLRDKDLGPLTIDGYDAEHNVGFEFISERDYFDLGGAQSSSTVQSYDFVPLARHLAEDARRDGSVRLGVFYDPMARVDWEVGPDGEYREPKNLRGRDQLRAQVRDFIAFLRTEKVL